MMCVVSPNEVCETKRGSALQRFDIVELGNMNASQRRRSALKQQRARQRLDEKKNATKSIEREKHKEMMKMFRNVTKMHKIHNMHKMHKIHKKKGSREERTE